MSETLPWTGVESGKGSRSWLLVGGFSLLTTLTLAGGLALAFVVGNLLFESMNVHLTEVASALLILPLFLVVLFGSGAAWGYAVARLTNGDTRRLVRVGGLTFGGAVLLVGIALELVFALLSALARVNPLPIHVSFTILFVPTAGAIAALCTRRMARVLGREDVRRKLGLASGLAAAIAFLTVNLVMLALGWQVGGPGAAERFTMITVTLTSNAGAALAGGAAMGWVLSGD
jgi:hypothetical protein